MGCAAILPPAARSEKCFNGAPQHREIFLLLTGIDRTAGFCSLRTTTKREPAVEIISGAAQAQMGECLWKVTQVLSTRADFLREKTQVIGVDESFLEKNRPDPGRPCEINTPRTRKSTLKMSLQCR